ncbi:MAG: LamG domain-containing protein [Polyangiaceae bacterium]|nr:LamG domain-containing protein [Polyangiaceae bacterium]
MNDGSVLQMKRPVPMQGSFAALGALGLCACDASTTIDLLPARSQGQAGQPEEAGPVGVAGARADAAGPPPAGPRVTAPLLHRYDFSGSGTMLDDRAGDADGSILGDASLDGSGMLTLDGVDDYVALPGGLISSLESVTFVTWFTWLAVGASGSWQRVFDFGSAVEGGAEKRTATAYFFFTPRYVPGPGDSANFNIEGIGGTSVDGAEPFPSQLEQQIAVVFDGQAGVLESYVNGVSEGRNTTRLRLSDLPDENCWLGQSQSSHDMMMHGRYNEFRIYGAALTRDDIGALLGAGPDVL